MSVKPDPQERAWIAAASRGDLAAMERLYEEHRGMVFAVGLGVCGNGPDADEVLQETFLRAFRSLEDFRGDARFGSWIYAIAMRTALNWKSRFLRRPAPAPEPESSDAPDAAERQEQVKSLTLAIDRLPLQQRLVITLKHLKGLSLAQIAEIQGCALGTVKSNLHHAMMKLKGALAPASGEAP